MRVKELLFDVWLGFGVLGMAIGMLAPFIFVAVTVLVFVGV